jgi:hypothetical protein
MKLIGIEKEYFVIGKDGKIADPEQMRNIPKDDCGFLAEARGKPDSDAYLAVYNLLAEEQRILNKVKKGLKLLNEPVMAFKMEDVLKFYDAKAIKAKEKSNSIYGAIPKTKVTKKTAGLHIHFSCSSSTTDEEGREIVIPMMIDIPSIIQQLDNAFSEEIKAAKRPFGAYRIKSYPSGNEGFEYRSLPNNVNIGKLIKVLQNLIW